MYIYISIIIIMIVIITAITPPKIWIQSTPSESSEPFSIQKSIRNPSKWSKQRWIFAFNVLPPWKNWSQEGSPAPGKGFWHCVSRLVSNPSSPKRIAYEVPRDGDEWRIRKTMNYSGAIRGTRHPNPSRVARHTECEILIDLGQCWHWCVMIDVDVFIS